MLKLTTGDLIKLKKNILRPGGLRIPPFYVIFTGTVEECEECFKDEIGYIKVHSKTPYKFVDMRYDTCYMYLNNIKVFSGKNSQKYFKTQENFSEWICLYYKKQIGYLPKNYLSKKYMEIVK